MDIKSHLNALTLALLLGSHSLKTMCRVELQFYLFSCSFILTIGARHMYVCARVLKTLKLSHMNDFGLSFYFYIQLFNL